MVGHAVDDMTVGNVLGVPVWDHGKYRLKRTMWGLWDGMMMDQNRVSVQWGMDKTVVGHVHTCMVDEQLGLMGFLLTVWVEWMWWNGLVSKHA